MACKPLFQTTSITSFNVLCREIPYHKYRDLHRQLDFLNSRTVTSSVPFATPNRLSVTIGKDLLFSKEQDLTTNLDWPFLVTGEQVASFENIPPDNIVQDLAEIRCYVRMRSIDP
jgi:hypothetical protein